MGFHKNILFYTQNKKLREYPRPGNTQRRGRTKRLHLSEGIKRLASFPKTMKNEPALATAPHRHGLSPYRLANQTQATHIEMRDEMMHLVNFKKLQLQYHHIIGKIWVVEGNLACTIWQSGPYTKSVAIWQDSIWPIEPMCFGHATTVSCLQSGGRFKNVSL